MPPLPRDGTCLLGDLVFHFLDWGTAGEPPMLLLHGGAQTAHSWDDVAPDLAGDHHVLALDQRGHGDSEWAPDGRYGGEDFAADVRAFLDEQGWEATTVVGLSLGGMNALAFAAAHPGRTSGLVVVDVAPTMAEEGTRAIAAQLARRDFASFEEAVAHAHAFNPRRSLENIRARLGHALRRAPEGGWTYKFDPRLGDGGLAVGAERLWERIRSVRCPTLLVRGAQSPVLSRETAARFVRELPGAMVVEVPRAGHSAVGDNPSGFVAAVRPFLARHGL